MATRAATGVPPPHLLRLLLLLVVVVVVVLAALVGGPGGMVQGAYQSCEPRGTAFDAGACMCKAGYDVQGLLPSIFTRQGKVIGRGFKRSCCRHCRCVPKTEEPSPHLYRGRHNRHPDVRPFSVRDDREALAQDMRVRAAVQDDRITMSLGAFEELQTQFPSCRLPRFTTSQDTTEVEGVDAAEAFVAGCAAKWEWAQQFHTSANDHSVVFAAWLSLRPDGQRGTTVGCSNVGYIARWYESVMTLGLHAIVFHDCAPKKLVNVLQNDRVRFERVPHNRTSPLHTKQALNDVRFVVFDEYLQRTARTYDHILVTDLHDVRFRRDPFSAMRARPDINIFIGQDRYPYNNNPVTWEVLGWCAPAYAQLPYSARFGDAMTLNCGVVGGKGPAVLRLLQHVVGLYKDRSFETRGCRAPGERYCDMAMFAIALMTGYETLREDPWAGETMGEEPRLRQPYRYDSGPPFTSLFDAWGSGLPSYVIHK